ncbi:hypothetical protein ACFLVB_04735 [Chloroflexota bacterium]
MAEEDSTTEPIYINMPKKLMEQFGGNFAVLYPHEWTDEQIKEWVKEDYEKIKLEDLSYFD